MTIQKSCYIDNSISPYASQFTDAQPSVFFLHQNLIFEKINGGLIGVIIEKVSSRMTDIEFNTIVGIIATIVTLLSFLKIKKKTITITKKTKLYKSPSKEGIFTFDYSNNNGEYVIGDGETSFTTKWSKASDTSIHAYKDGKGITAIALRKGVENIDSIENIEGDFSSRCRTAQIGDAIIWKNVNGRTAITKVISIKDDTRGDSQDELTCEYYIFK